MPKLNFAAILHALVAHHVNFIVVGGVARFFKASHLASSGHQLLMTLHGPLDLPGAIGLGRDYTELIQKAIAVQIAEGLTVPVLELASLIAVKEETAGEKDRAVLPILRQTLRERQ